MAQRISMGFQASPPLALRVNDEELAKLEQALGGEGWHTVEAEDGSVRLNLAHVLWMRTERAEHRVGAVVRTPCGAVGASTLILAAVTAFYDVQRAGGEDFFIYPDFFLFHVGRPLGDHSMLDVWPGHKEVVVTGGPDALLEAINDRGVTHLAVEDGAPGGA